MNRKISLVAFDLDGTLVDSRRDLAASINKALRSASFPEREFHEFNRIIGNGQYTAIVRSCPAGTQKEIIDRLALQFLDDYAENCCVETFAYVGIAELIDVLRAHGIKMAVVTNKSQKAAEKVTDFYFPGKPFSLISGDRKGMPLKPDPMVGILLCRELGIPPEETLYLGDGGSDMDFAHNAGFYAVGAEWGFRGRQELAEHGADAIICHPVELLELI
jgi:phosphoglycolate phosphatase